MRILNKDIVSDIMRKIENNEKLSRFDKIEYQNIKGTRKANISYSYDDEEMIEYSKCYNDVFYFAEKYCKIMIEDGSTNNIKLRDYQINVLNKYSSNRFFINLTSRQMGNDVISAIYFLHKMLFGADKIIGIISHVIMNSVSILDKIKNIYKKLPFFLKKGIVSWNNTKIVFENGSLIDIITFYNKGLSIGKNYDIILINDFSKIKEQEYLYKLIFPTISSMTDSQLFIKSGPNGYCFFNKLVEETEDGHPNRNVFNIIRTYWWQVPGRDDKWKQDEIKKLGSEELFMQEYGLYFIIKR